MTKLQVADFLVGLLQAFLLSNLVCRHFATKFNYKWSLFISVIGMQVLYLIMNYNIYFYEIRVLTGIIGFCMIGFIIFKGTIVYIVLLSIAEYFFLIVMDIFNYFFIYDWMGLSFEEDMFISLRLLLARNMYNITIYLVLMLIEIWIFRRNKEQIQYIAILGSVFAIVQLFASRNLYQASSGTLTENAIFVSVFYSGIVIMGYFIVMEMIEQIVSQNKKEEELKREILEQNYQYEYYLRAYNEAETIRNIRHDMRNQLQTIEYMFQSNKCDLETVKGMIENLYESMEQN